MRRKKALIVESFGEELTFINSGPAYDIEVSWTMDGTYTATTITDDKRRELIALLTLGRPD